MNNLIFNEETKQLHSNLDKSDKNMTDLTNNSQIEEINKIENHIQELFHISVPVLILEYNHTSLTSNLIKWDSEDLKEFFFNFGKIELFEVNGMTTIVLFKTFFEAYSAKEFLMSSNHISETSRTNFHIKWYTQDYESMVSELMKERIKRFTCGDIVENINMVMLNSSIDSNTQMYPSSLKIENYSTNSVEHYNNYTKFSLCPIGRKEFNEIMLGNKRRSAFTYANANNIPSAMTISNQTDGNGNEFESNGEKCFSNGKFTCKFWIQIESDIDFQVAQRLVGAKGCNIKRIIDFCSKGANGIYLADSVKLRLRGKGSGYKEGPYNRGRNINNYT